MLIYKEMVLRPLVKNIRKLNMRNGIVVRKNIT